MKFVQATQMLQKCFQRLGNGRKLQVAMDDNIKYWQESETDVAKVDREWVVRWRRTAALLQNALRRELFWVLSVES